MSLLRHCGASENEAEEVFAEVFTTVMGKVDPVRRGFAEAQMVNLLKASCKNRWIDERRHRAVFREVTLSEAEVISDPRQEDPDELVERIEEIEVGREAVLTLSDRDQEVFRLRYQLDLSPDEIQGRVPGLSARAYRKVIQRANARVLSAYERIEKGERCEELRAGVLKSFVVGDAPAPEVVAVEAHLRHCRACQIACQQMHDHLRDVGSSLAVAIGSAGSASATTTDIAQQLVGQAETIGGTTQGIRERIREAILKVPGFAPGSGGGEAPLGQVINLSGKVIAACAGGAAAAACTAAIVVPALDPAPRDDVTPVRAPVVQPPAAAKAGAGSEAGAARADGSGGRESERSHSAGGERAQSKVRRTWTADRGPAPKPRSKITSSGQETGSDFGMEADEAGSPVSTAEIEAATAPSEPSASRAGGSAAAPSTGGESSGGGSSEFGM